MWYRRNVDIFMLTNPTSPLPCIGAHSCSKICRAWGVEKDKKRCDTRKIQVYAGPRQCYTKADCRVPSHIHSLAFNLFSVHSALSCCSTPAQAAITGCTLDLAAALRIPGMLPSACPLQIPGSRSVRLQRRKQRPSIAVPLQAFAAPNAVAPARQEPEHSTIPLPLRLRIDPGDAQLAKALCSRLQTQRVHRGSQQRWHAHRRPLTLQR